MTPQRSRVVLVLAIVLPIALAACSGAGAGPSARATPAASADLTIYAAASLKGAVEAAEAAYEAANPGTTVTIATDSSAALRTQIEQGAPADVFLSADTKNPQTLVDAGLAEGDPVTFAVNQLTVIVPADNPAGITAPPDLAAPGIKIMAAGDEVPITRYATELVGTLALEPGYPADFAALYAANVVSREDNVKAVVAKVELGEGDAGIVYVTDAMASDKVTTIEVPDAANVPATYDGVVIKASANTEAAKAFLAWFAGPGGQSILADFGFLPPAP